MTRRIWTFGLLGLSAVATGCSMCQNPYDYAGPVVGHSGCPNCGFNTRAGSAFNPSSAPVGTYQASTPTPAAVPASGKPTPAPVEQPESETPSRSAAAPAPLQRR